MLIAHLHITITSYRNLNNNSHDASMRYHIFDIASAKSAKAKSNKEPILASAKSAKGRFLEDMSMSLDLAPNTFAYVAKSGKAIDVVVIDSKSSKAKPLPVTRSIDPLTISNDDNEVSAALSFVEYSSPQEEETSDALSLATTAVATLMIIVVPAALV